MARCSASVVRRRGCRLLCILGSVLFAALSVILDKAGITGVESNLGTAIRTGEALVMAWVMVAVAGKLGEVRTVSPALPWLPGPLTVPLGSATTGSSSTALSA